MVPTAVLIYLQHPALFIQPYCGLLPIEDGFASSYALGTSNARLTDFSMSTLGRLYKRVSWRRRSRSIPGRPFPICFLRQLFCKTHRCATYIRYRRQTTDRRTQRYSISATLRSSKNAMEPTFGINTQISLEGSDDVKWTVWRITVTVLSTKKNIQ